MCHTRRTPERGRFSSAASRKAIGSHLVFRGPVKAQGRVLLLRGDLMLDLLTENDVSKRLNVSVASLRRWRLQGRGPAFLKVGCLVRYRPEDLDSWIAHLSVAGYAGERGVALTQAGTAS